MYLLLVCCSLPQWEVVNFRRTNEKARRPPNLSRWPTSRRDRGWYLRVFRRKVVQSSLYFTIHMYVYAYIYIHMFVYTCSYRAISRTRHCPRVGAVLYAFGHILRFTSSCQWRHRFRNCVFTPLRKRWCYCFRCLCYSRVRRLLNEIHFTRSSCPSVHSAYHVSIHSN